MAKTLGECIKEIRTAAGDKPAEAAAKIGVSRQGYLKWETGDTENMKLRHLVTFCDKYGIDVESLARGAPRSAVLYVSRGAGKTKPVFYDVKSSEPTAAKSLAVNEPDPNETLLLEAFRNASPDLKRIMLSNAREILELFEKRSEHTK